MNKSEELINHLIHNKVDELNKLYKTNWKKDINFDIVLDKINNQSNPSVNNFLGFMYINGHGIEQNDEKAFNYYQLSADQGNLTAQNNLGYMYQHGHHVEQNYEKAFNYYQLSADQGESFAQCHLAIMYLHGLGIEQDYEKALYYYQLAADQGVSIAQLGIEKLLSDWCHNCLNKYIKTKTTKCKELEDRCKELEDRCKELEEDIVHLKYKPGGPGYYESKQDFEKYQ